MKRIFTLAFFPLFFAGCRSAVRTSHDVIYLRQGEEMTGMLERISADSVWFRTDEGLKAYSKDEVKGVDLPQPRPGEEWQTAQDINDKVLKEILSEFTPPQADVPYINLYVKNSFALRQDGTFEKKRRVIRYVANESGKGQAANNTWEYLADRAFAKVDFARSIGPEGKVTHINEAAINRVSLFPAPSEYSNLTQLQIAVPESRVGSILDFQFTTIQTVVDSVHPLAEEVVLADRQPTRKEIITVEYPEEKELSVYLSQKAQEQASAETNSSKGRQIKTWTITDRPALRYELMTPPPPDYLPRFIIASRTDWYAVSSALRLHLEEASEPGERIPVLVDSLTSGLDAPLDKAKALYTFVAEEIRTVPPPPSLYSYVPTPAETVLTRGFANNLDRNTLLYTLLNTAGLEADLILGRSHASGELVPTFPTLGQLNYALTLYENETYLDPLPHLPFGTLLEQDVMGLNLESGKLKKTPLLEAEAESRVRKASAGIDQDGNLKLEWEVRLEGEQSARWKRTFMNQSREEFRQTAEEIASSLHPNAVLEDFSFEGTKPLNEDVSYSLTVRIPGYAVRAGQYLIFSLPGVSYSAYDVGAEDRHYPIDRRLRSAEIYTLTMDYPANARLVYYPEDVSVTTDYDSYTATFLNPGGKSLEFTETAKVLEPEIPPEDYPQYKMMVEEMARLSQEPVVLKLR